MLTTQDAEMTANSSAMLGVGQGGNSTITEPAVLGRNSTVFPWTTVAPEDRSCIVYQWEQSNITLSGGEVAAINVFWWVSNLNTVFFIY